MIVCLTQDIEILDLRCPLLRVNETHVPRVQQAAAPPPPKEALTPIAILMKVHQWIMRACAQTCSIRSRHFAAFKSRLSSICTLLAGLTT